MESQGFDCAWGSSSPSRGQPFTAPGSKGKAKETPIVVISSDPDDGTDFEMTPPNWTGGLTAIEDSPAESVLADDDEEISLYSPSSVPASEPIPSSQITNEGEAFLHPQSRVKGLSEMRALLALSPEVCRGILDDLSCTIDGWCRLANIKPNKSNGYPQVSWRGMNHVAVAGEIALWARGEMKPYKPHGNIHPVEDQVFQISHLCGKSRCVVPEHVVVETAQENNSRKGCAPWVDCSEHCSLCRGRKVIWRCPHKPGCIMYHAGFPSIKELKEKGICRDDAEKSRDQARRLADARTVGLSRGQL